MYRSFSFACSTAYTFAQPVAHCSNSLLQTSRAGRLAAFADSQLSNHSDMPDTGGGGGGGRGGGQLAEVVYTSLVVAEGRKERERGRKKNTGQRSGGKNFKRFRKV